MNHKLFIFSFLLLPLVAIGQLNLQPDSVISVNVVWDRANMNTQGELGGGDTLVFEVPENSIWKLNHWGWSSSVNSIIKVHLLTKKTITSFGNYSGIADLNDGDFLWLAGGDKIIVYNSAAIGYYFNGNCTCSGAFSLNALQFKTQ